MYPTLAKSAHAKISKVDESLGVVFGYAIVCKENGVDYVDRQGDVIPEASMLKAALQYMLGDRPAQVQHTAASAGRIVFCWPMTQDIAKAFGIETQKTGLLVGMKTTPDVLSKFKDGSLTGFSIGGRVLESA